MLTKRSWATGLALAGAMIFATGSALAAVPSFAPAAGSFLRVADGWQADRFRNDEAPFQRERNMRRQLFQRRDFRAERGASPRPAFQEERERFGWRR